MRFRKRRHSWKMCGKMWNLNSVNDKLFLLIIVLIFFKFISISFDLFYFCNLSDLEIKTRFSYNILNKWDGIIFATGKRWQLATLPFNQKLQWNVKWALFLLQSINIAIFYFVLFCAIITLWFHQVKNSYLSALLMTFTLIQLCKTSCL